MSKTSDGGRYFAGTANGYEGSPVLEVYAGQIMAVICGRGMDALDFSQSGHLVFLQERAPELAKAAVISARALLVELGYPTKEEEEAQRKAKIERTMQDLPPGKGIDKEIDGMDPHEIDL